MAEPRAAQPLQTGTRVGFHAYHALPASKRLPGMKLREELLMKKRFVALLLCLVMVVGLIPGQLWPPVRS